MLEAGSKSPRALSPFSASPQQLRGEPPVPADDVYGLGALAYELLSGYPPHYPHFDAQRMQREPVPPLEPAQPMPPMPPHLGALIELMLAKDASERPASMREIIDELDVALNDTLTFDFETAEPPREAALANPTGPPDQPPAVLPSPSPLNPPSRALAPGVVDGQTPGASRSRSNASRKPRGCSRRSSVQRRRRWPPSSPRVIARSAPANRSLRPRPSMWRRASIRRMSARRSGRAAPEACRAFCRCSRTPRTRRARASTRARRRTTPRCSHSTRRMRRPAWGSPGRAPPWAMTVTPRRPARDSRHWVPAASRRRARLSHERAASVPTGSRPCRACGGSM